MNKPSSPNQPTNWRALYAIALVGLVNLFGFGLVFPLLPRLTTRFGGGGSQMGWIIALYALMGLLLSPIMGMLSDRFGRKPLITWGLVGVAAGHALFALTGYLVENSPFTNAFFIMYLARVVGGGFSAHMGVAQAYITDNTSPQDRARGMGIMGMGYGAGFVLGPAAGGLLAHRFGLFMPFWVAATTSVLAAVIAQIVLKNNPAPKRVQTEKTSLWRSLSLDQVLQPQHRGPFALFFLVPFGFAALELAIVMYGERQLGLGEAHLGGLFAFAGVLVVFTQGFLLGWLRKHFSELTLIRVGAMLLPIGMFLVPVTKPLLDTGRYLFAPSVGLWLVAAPVAIAFLAVGDGLKEPSLMAYFSHRAEGENQGGLMGMAQSVMGLGRVLGPLFAGQVFDRIGRAWPFLTGGVFLAGGLVISFTLLQPPKTLAHEDALCARAAS